VTTIPISADGQAIALACSGLALQGESSIKPLTPREWHELSGAIVRSDWARPRELLGREPAELRDELGVASEMAERLSRLLARGGQLAFEIERLASRGIWVLTRADDSYPPRLKKLLLGQAPPVLYGAGPQTALSEPALAVIGSRNASEAALEFARGLGRQCARQRVTVVSGAARGVDLEAMLGALEAGGMAVGVTVDPLERLVRRPALRIPLSEETLTLVTPFHPAARWQAGNAMRRNRFVYIMSQAAVVAATDAGSGGTWTGAIENIEHRWVPVYVRDDGEQGSRELIRAGAIPLAPESPSDVDVQSLFHIPLTSLLDEAQPGTTASGDEKAAEVQLEPGNATDAFWVVWPLLDACLQVPRSERDVADKLHLQLVQTRTWLNRAVDEGLVKLTARPRKLYVVRDSEQLSLG
jgi:DNA processing protein